VREEPLECSVLADPVFLLEDADFAEVASVGGGGFAFAGAFALKVEKTGEFR
jgi:hypothetical protein